jgi:hypothetical protein
MVRIQELFKMAVEHCKGRPLAEFRRCMSETIKQLEAQYGYVPKRHRSRKHKKTEEVPFVVPFM